MNVNFLSTNEFVFFFFLGGRTIVDLIGKLLAKTPSQAQWQKASKNLRMNFCIVGFYNSQGLL
jgi:hypothetical protein